MPAANDSLIGGSTNIQYPDGFNYNNCIIISLMSHNTMHEDWWSTSSNSKYTNSMIKGSGDLTATLKPDNIMVSSNKVTTEEDRKDVTFKITLMKLPELEEQMDYTLGDINGDGNIDNDDMEVVRQYILATGGLTTKQFASADINKDGEVDAIDMTLLQRMINGQT